MSFCPVCGADCGSSIHFCPKCGASLSQNQGFSSSSWNSAPNSFNTMPGSAPTYPMSNDMSFGNYTPVVPTGAKVLAFIGLGLAITSLIFTVMGLFYTIVTMGVRGVGFSMALTFALISLPFSIPGAIMCSKSRSLGFRGAAASVGVKLAIVSFILAGVAMLLGVINIMTGRSYYYY